MNLVRIVLAMLAVAVVAYSPPEGPSRTLHVVDVGSNGTARAVWALDTATNFRNTKATVNGGDVTVVTSANSRVQLRRVGDDQLVGTFTLGNGSTYGVIMSRAE